jgi:phosphatidylinositol alpha-1,6-mannosyltransferase
VLVLTPDYPPAKGGIQILMHELTQHFRDVVPTVVTLGGCAAARADDQQLAHRVRRAPDLPLRPLTMMGLYGCAVAEGLSERPDVVLCGHIVAAPAAAILRRLLGIPVILYLHAKEVGIRPQLARFAVRHADAIVAVSRYTRQLALDSGATPGQIHIIHPGTSPVGAVSLERERPPTVVTVSRLEDRYKGHDILLRALPLVRAKIPDVRWVVIGDGPLRPVLADLSLGAGLEGVVQFLGAVEDDERDEWMRRAWVFAMISRLPAGRFAGEGFGIVYLEANAHGTPALAGNVGGAIDAVDDEVTGVLVEPTDHVAVAGALVDLLQDEERRRRLGAQGAARTDQFAWPRVAEQVEQLIADLLA